MASERAVRIRWALVALGAFALLLGLEVLTDDDPFALGDFLVDALTTALVVVSAVGTTLLAIRFQVEREARTSLTRDLEIARAEGEAWRQRAQTYLSGLGEEIERQFEHWALTPAEREIALLMLKGFSHAEIAGLRGTTEATVRHQARAVYQKSRLPGRTAFCAYFLEDLFPPPKAPAEIHGALATSNPEAHGGMLHAPGEGRFHGVGRSSHLGSKLQSISPESGPASRKTPIPRA
jgi:DNA-binding CsgD family transcriptional regulator